MPLNAKNLYDNLTSLCACNSPLLQLELDTIESITLNDKGIGAISLTFGSTEAKKVRNLAGANSKLKDIFVSKCYGLPRFEKDRSKTGVLPGAEEWPLSLEKPRLFK